MKLTDSRAFRKRRHRFKWRRRSRVILLDLLGREETPERVAAAIGLGVGIGFSPFIGLHLALALLLAWLFHLNKIDTVLGTLAGQIPTWTPVFPLGYRVGRALLGYDRYTVRRLNWDAIFHSHFTWIFHPVETVHRLFGWHAIGPRVASFLVGTTFVATLLGLAAYAIALALLRLYHRRHPRVAIRAARRRQDCVPTASEQP
jgi:uncharacterized protein (DUF2062 family)